MTRQALAAAVSAVLAVSLARAGAPAPLSNLWITNTDSTDTYSAGDSVTYTIKVSNAGNDDAIGATVTDVVGALPQVASASWTCVAVGSATCTAGPVAGDISDTVNLPVGDTVTYTLVVATTSSAVGDLVNTAQVTPPAGTPDPWPANNTAIDTDAHEPSVSDLSITSTDGVAFYTAGGSVTYTLVVGNTGPDAALGATVTDAVTALAQVSGAAWTCVGAGGATCTAGPITGDIVGTVDLPVGGTVTYTLVVKTNSSATGDLVNTATVTPPVGTTEPVPDPSPDTATDTDTAATIFYVATAIGGGADSGSCGPSATPCLTVQRAIDNTTAGDTVIVRAGTYKECVVLVSGDGAGGVRVESEEFFTIGTVLATILDGTGACDGGGVPPSPVGPVATLFDKSTLRGFRITNGGDSGVSGLGAVAITNNVISGNTNTSTGGEIRLETGIYLTDPLAKAEIKANTIQKNTDGSHGAGIFVDATANGVPSLVEIDGNTVTTNTAGGTISVSGSGITVFTDTIGAADSSRVVITGNTLDGNIATSDGGGIFVATGSVNGLGTETVTIGGVGHGNVIRNNVSDGLGGGMSVWVQPAPGGKHTLDVVANTVTANTGKRGGGGAHLFANAIDCIAGATPDVVLRASGNTFIGNHAQGDLSDPNAVGGGGIYAELHSDRTVASAVQFEISGNTIERNDATTHGGGASLLASADDDPDNPSTTIAPAEAVISFHNNLIAKNLARDMTAGVPSGGGVHGLVVARGALALARLSQSFLTVADNETELDTGGLEWEDLLLTDSLGLTGAASFELSNSIVTGNDGYGVGYRVPLDPATAVAVSYTDAFGNPSGDYESPLGDPTGTNGNIKEDAELDALFLPRLCGPTIDVGDPAIDLGDPPIEPQPNGGRVNLGHLGNTASATRTFPDVNGDGTIDGLDVLGIAVSFNSLGGGPRFFAEADRDLDGDVDGEDLAYVSAFYAQSCP